MKGKNIKADAELPLYDSVSYGGLFYAMKRWK